MGQCMGKTNVKVDNQTLTNPTTAKESLKFKVVLVGESDVGKSSLIGRYTSDQFTSEVNEFVEKVVDVNGQSVTITIFDTQGMEKFKTITSSFYDGSGGIVLVYDITNSSSFNVLDNWFQECGRYAVHAEILLLGNKCDLEDQRQVTKESLEEIARNHSCAYQEVSAKTGSGVTEAFIKLIKIMMGEDKLMGSGSNEDEDGDGDGDGDEEDDGDDDSKTKKKKK